MAYFEDDIYQSDERGLNGFDRVAIEFVDDFLDKLLVNARVYRLGGQDVMCLHQLKQVVSDFLKVDYDGHVRITSSREDGLGTRNSVIEFTPHLIVIGVSGFDGSERGGEPYDDVYFSVGEQMESDTLDDDLSVWEEDFFAKLTHPDSTLTVEGEIANIREAELSAFSEDEDEADDDIESNDTIDFD
ncbi:MAG: hypothetical protein RIQ47_967 [Bacteroidota bacterium]|jgi:hypothetical protein